MDKDFTKIEAFLDRIATALESRHGAAPAGAGQPLPPGDVFVWEAEGAKLVPVSHVSVLPLGLLKGIDNARDTLLENTARFAAGLPANNALLWGARGMGKSSLVKAAHAEVNRGAKGRARLALIEIH